MNATSQVGPALRRRPDSGQRRSAVPTYHSLLPGLLAVLLLAVAAPAATFFTETFEGGANGWGGAGNGMTVSHEGSVGLPASGAMQGVFDAQLFFPIPQTDSFVINSGANFLGSYAGLTGFTFDLFADTVLPSDLAIRIWSDTSVFFYAMSLNAMNLNTWTTFTVPLTYTSGWQADGQAAFDLVLADVTQVEVQLTRNGMGEQYFYLDNFGTLNTPFEVGSAVPEPSTGLMVLYFGAILLGIRKRALEDWVDGEEAI